MLKAKINYENGRTLLLLGLSDENLAKLKQGLPAHITGEEVQMPKTDVMIFHGKDEAAMLEVLRPYIGKDTIIKNPPPLM